MKRIGIITAMSEEFTVIEELMKNIEVIEKHNLKFYCGLINKKEVALVQCGVGKVNSARATQMMIDIFNIEYIINVGVAGSLNEKLEIGDIVIGEKLVQHDFDTTACGDEKGYITGVGKNFISDINLIEKCNKIIKANLNDINIKVGTIATGDVFCQETSLKNEIIKEFNADCVEMEGGAIAQVCTLSNIPFIVIRSISDKPNGHNNIDFKKYVVSSSKKFSKLIELLI